MGSQLFTKRHYDQVSKVIASMKNSMGEGLRYRIWQFHHMAFELDSKLHNGRFKPSLFRHACRIDDVVYDDSLYEPSLEMDIEQIRNIW